MSDTNGSTMPSTCAYRFGQTLAWVVIAALVPLALVAVGLVARLAWWCLEIGWGLT